MTKDILDRMEERPTIDHWAALAMQSMMATKEGQEYIGRDDFRSVAMAAYGMACAMWDYRSELIQEECL